MVVFDKFPGLDQHWISNWDGSISSDVERRFRASAEWKEFEELLLATPSSGQEESRTSQPIDQRENLRDAILKKKARIVEIERILNCPPQTEHLGRPVHGGQNFRLRLEEERQHLMLAVDELEAEQRKALVDRAIASRKRKLESLGMQEGARHTDTPALDAQQSRSLLGIELARLEHLRRGVWRKVFDEASISRVVEDEWKTVLSSRKMPDSGVDLGLTFALTKEYEKAISRTSAQLADLLATAVGSRINQAQLREAIWRECLDFAYQLGQWDAFATWVHRAVHIGWQPLDADGTPSLALDPECEKRLEERRTFFEERIGMYSQEWLSAIDEAIDLLLTVSVAHTVNASGEIEKQTLDLASAPAKAIAAEPKVQQPQLTPRELKVWEVIKRGVKGLEYCRELGNARIAPLQSGIWKGCPRKYESAYLQGEPWRHRIQDEKSKIRRKAELAGLAKLAGE